MLIGRVVGQLVSTQKDHNFFGTKLMLVQPLDAGGQPRGNPVLAVDCVGAGVGEPVLLVVDGRAAQDAIRRKPAPVDAAIIGIVDAIDLETT